MAAEVLDEACSQGRPNPKAMKAMGRASRSAKATSQCSSRAEAEIAELYTSLCGYASIWALLEAVISAAIHCVGLPNLTPGILLHKSWAQSDVSC